MLKVNPLTWQPWNPGSIEDDEPFIDWERDERRKRFLARFAATLPYLRTFAELVGAAALVGIFILAWVALPA